VFCFALPLDRYAPALPNIILIFLLGSFPFIIKKEDFKILKRKEVLLLGLLITYVVINSMLFQDFTQDLKFTQKIASTLLPVILFLPIKYTNNLKISLIISVLCCILYSLFQICIYYINSGSFEFSSGGVINEILPVERLYLGFICVLSVVLSISLLRKNQVKYRCLYFNILLCSIFVFLIVSRIAVILLLILFFIQIFYTRYRRKFAMFFFLFIAVATIAFTTNKNLNQRFFYSQSTQKQKGYIELLKQWEPRFLIWDCSYNIITTNDIWITGLGFSKTKDYLVSCYKEVVKQDRRRKYFVESRFNTHNQFIDFWLSAGVLSTIIFMCFFAFLFLKNRKLFFQTALILSLLLFSSVENIFHRQLGCYLFGIILVFLVNEDDKKSSTLQG
tara:strand:+ start:407 stop:1576 length:1170 start_codon:yes stop_codon:yes gene_type:complete